MEENIAKVILLIFFARMAYQDWKEKQIDIYILVVVAFIGVFMQAYVWKDDVQDILLGVCVGAVVLLLSWITGGGIGAGDGMLLMVSGIFLGFWGNASLFMTALVMVGAVALFMIAVKKKGKNYRLPFAPFLLVAYLFQLI